MSGTSGQDLSVQPHLIPPGGFAAPQDDQPSLISAVGFIVLGFGFMATFTVLGLVLGAGVVSALVIAWIGSIAAILLVAVLVAWRETSLERTECPGLETVLEWEADLKADLREAQAILAWDYDTQIDAATADDTDQKKRRA